MILRFLNLFICVLKFILKSILAVDSKKFQPLMHALNDVILAIVMTLPVSNVCDRNLTFLLLLNLTIITFMQQKENKLSSNP